MAYRLFSWKDKSSEVSRRNQTLTQMCCYWFGGKFVNKVCHCTLQYMKYEQRCITDTKTFPISKLGGWNHTILCSIKSPRRTDPKCSNTLESYTRLMLWKSVYNWHLMRTVKFWGDIGLSPASSETTQTNKPLKHYTLRSGARTRVQV